MERLRRAVERAAIPHPASSASPVVTISVGVAERHVGGPFDGSGILGRADAALYRAKQAGRNRVGLDTSPAPGA